MKWLSRLLCWLGSHDWREMDGNCCECGYSDMVPPTKEQIDYARAWGEDI